VAELAARQHGVVSRAQLEALGIGRRTIDRRLGDGRLHRLHRGVYAVGHARLGVQGRYWAAALTGGVLSHRTAAAVWDILPPPSGRLDVTTLRNGRSTATLRVHRSSTLTAADVTRVDGLPVTTPSRTLVDLAGELTPHRLARACHRAEVLRLLDAAAVLALAARLPGRRTRPLRAALATLALTGPDVTRSELEERFLAVVAGARLPPPAVNARVAGHEVDFLWPAAKLIVEADGAATHLTPTAFEHDRRRDAELQLAGYRVVRVTWRRVVDEPIRLAGELLALLDAPYDAGGAGRTGTSGTAAKRRGARSSRSDSHTPTSRSATHPSPTHAPARTAPSPGGSASR